MTEQTVSEQLLDVVPAQAPESPAASTPAPPAAGADQPQSEAADPKDVELAELRKAMRGVQKRIDQTVRESRAAAEQERFQAEQWRREAEAAKQQLEALSKGQQPPRLEQFQNLEDYTQAVAEFKANQVADKRVASERDRALQAQAEANASAQQAAMAARLQQIIQTKVNEAVQKHPDFMEKINSPELPDIRGTQAFWSILDSEHSGDIMYYLASNPARLHQLLSLSPVGQGREVGLIEAAIKNGAAVSSAPPPAATVKGSGERGAHKGWADMNFEEYRKARRAGRSP